MSDDPKKSVVIQVRASRDQRELITRAAQKDGLDVSSWLRSLGIKRARELNVSEKSDEGLASAGIKP